MFNIFNVRVGNKKEYGNCPICEKEVRLDIRHRCLEQEEFLKRYVKMINSKIVIETYRINEESGEKSAWFRSL